MAFPIALDGRRVWAGNSLTAGYVPGSGPDPTNSFALAAEALWLADYDSTIAAFLQPGKSGSVPLGATCVIDRGYGSYGNNAVSGQTISGLALTNSYNNQIGAFGGYTDVFVEIGTNDLGATPVLPADGGTGTTDASFNASAQTIVDNIAAGRPTAKIHIFSLFGLYPPGADAPTQAAWDLKVDHYNGLLSAIAASNSSRAEYIDIITLLRAYATAHGISIGNGNIIGDNAADDRHLVKPTGRDLIAGFVHQAVSRP